MSQVKGLVIKATLAIDAKDYACAITLLNQALDQKPLHSRANFLLSVTRLRIITTPRTSPASFYLDPLLKALKHSPSKPFLHYGVALVRSTLNDPNWLLDAIKTFTFSISQNNIPVLTSIAGLYRKHKKWHQAIQCGVQLTTWDPSNLKARSGLGTCYRRQGNLLLAKEQYHYVLEALITESTNDPGDSALSIELIEHWYKSCGGIVAATSTTTTMAPSSFVRGLYDGYAHKFDDHLLGKLQYRTPLLLTTALIEHSKESVALSFQNICDLGCGTGLMLSAMLDAGIIDARHAVSIGIDLSSGMIEKAKEKNIYTDLRVGEMSEVLNVEKKYDLVCCCDVYPYVGDLNSSFESIRSALVQKSKSSDESERRGYFCFSTEEWRDVKDVKDVKDDVTNEMTTESNGYVLNSTGRYLHRKRYVEEVAIKNHFDVLYLKSVVLRMNAGQPVHGLVGVLVTV